MLRADDFEVVHDEKSARVAAAMRPPQPPISHIDLALEIAGACARRYGEYLVATRLERWLDPEILRARADPSSHWPGLDPEPPLSSLPMLSEMRALRARDADHIPTRLLRDRQTAALLCLAADRCDEHLPVIYEGRSYEVHPLAVLYALDPKKYATIKPKLAGRILFREVGTKPKPTAAAAQAPAPVRAPLPIEHGLITRLIAAGDRADEVARTPAERAAAVAWLNTIYRHTPEGLASARARDEAIEARWRTEHPGEPLPARPFGRIRRPLAGLLNANGEFTTTPKPVASATPSPADFDPLSLLPAHLRPSATDPDDDTPGLIPVDL